MSLTLVSDKHRILIINPTKSGTKLDLPYLWLCLKAYHQEYGNSDHIWLDPITDLVGLTFDDLMRNITELKPTIVGFSCYLWNIGVIDPIAQAVKLIDPSITVVYGGPHNSYKHDIGWFKKRPCVDVVCDSQAFGEVFFSKLLDGHPYSDIPGAVYPKFGMWEQSRATVDKRNFTWPSNVLSANDEFLTRLWQNTHQSGRSFALHWETARGCPYGCTFCEWGGGINSKISFKPDVVIASEMQEFITYGINEIHIIDANFGIIPRDVETIRSLVTISSVSELNQVWLYGKSKNNKQSVIEIDTLLADNELTDLDMFIISVNTSTPEIAEAAKRKNLPIDDLIKLATDFSAKYGTQARMEFLIGLPMATLDSFYNEFDIFDKIGNWSSERYTWALLPGSPGAEPDYRTKYGIQTASVPFYHGDDLSQQVPQMDDEYNMLFDPEYATTYDIVVATNSYSREDWVEMYVVDHLVRAWELSMFTASCRQSVPASVFWRQTWTYLLDYTGISSTHIQWIIHQVTQIATNECQWQHEFFDSMGLFDTRIKLESYFNQLVLWDTELLAYVHAKWEQPHPVLIHSDPTKVFDVKIQYKEQ
jgi:hypothetical protein